MMRRKTVVFISLFIVCLLVVGYYSYTKLYTHDPGKPIKTPIGNFTFKDPIYSSSVISNFIEFENFTPTTKWTEIRLLVENNEHTKSITSKVSQFNGSLNFSVITDTLKTCSFAGIDRAANEVINQHDIITIDMLSNFPPYLKLKNYTLSIIYLPNDDIICKGVFQS